MSGGQNTLTLRIPLGSVNSLVDGWADAVAEGIRPAAQAAAQVLYDDVQSNVARIKKRTGNLASSIYQVYSELNSSQGRAVYHVSWNARKAPHAGLVEYGHLQRYRYYKSSDGQIRPMVRPGMDGKARPTRRASQAQKDAYYVPLPQPVQVAARPFLRPAVSKFDQAMDAARAELIKRINGGAL
jgi:hypothetical protein